MKIELFFESDLITKDGRQVVLHVWTDNNIINGVLNINRSNPYILRKTYPAGIVNEKIKQLIRDELKDTFQNIVKDHKARSLQGQKFEVMVNDP